MIKKDQSLKTKFEFNVSRKYGVNYSGKFFYMYMVKPTNYKGISKLGVVVSLKYDKRATQRNRVKRLLKEAFTEFINKNNDKSLWISVYPKSSAKYKKYEEISTDVNSVLSKISIS